MPETSSQQVPSSNVVRSAEPASHPAIQNRPTGPIALPPCGRFSKAVCEPERVEKIGNLQVPDPYRRFENLKDPEVRAWIQTKTSESEKALLGAPAFAEFQKRVQELDKIPVWSLPVIVGDQEFYTYREVGKNQSDLVVRNSKTGVSRTLVDVNGMSAKGEFTLSTHAVSPGGKYVAYLISQSGTENNTIRVRNVATGEDLNDPRTGTTLKIENSKYGAVVWNPDGTGFYYTLTDGDPVGAARKVYYKDLQDGSEKLVWRGRSKGEYAIVSSSADSKFEAIVATQNGTEWDIFLRDRREKDSQFKRISGEKPTPMAAYFSGNSLFVLSYEGAPNGRIYEVELERPDRANWIERISPRDGIFLSDFSITKGGLLTRSTKNVGSYLEYFDFQGRKKSDVPLPPAAVVTGVRTSARTPDAYISWSSLAHSPEILRLDLDTKAAHPWASSNVPGKDSKIVVEQKFFTSADGVSVPMYIAHRADVTPNGKNPVIAEVYGGLRFVLLPRYSSMVSSWLEKGGVYVLVNARGGGEYGDAWHVAGTKENKQNTFNDVAAGISELVRLKWTKPEKTVLYGGSNGGLTALSTGLQWPERFGGIVAAAPLGNMLRYGAGGKDNLILGEYGSLENPTELKGLLDMSPLHRVRAGVKYPRTHVMAGARDIRVPPFHGASVVAAILDANPKNKASLFIHEFGHVGTANSTAQLMAAQILTFAAEVTGLDRDRHAKMDQGFFPTLWDYSRRAVRTVLR